MPPPSTSPVQPSRHVAPADAYTFVLHVMVGLLIIGFVANLLVHPVGDRYFTGVPTGTIPGGPRPSVT